MTPSEDQKLESYVPVYDVAPEKWEDARPFLVEVLKKITNSLNLKEIGWYLDEELLSGKAFIPSAENIADGSTSQMFRSILRKVIDLGALVNGLNAGVPHGIMFDDNFTLIDLWVAGTDSNTFTARNISGNDVVMDAINLVITSPQAFNRAYAIIEYIQEL